MPDIARRCPCLLRRSREGGEILMCPQLAQFTDHSFLSLRVIVAAIFVASGWNHLRDSKRRSTDPKLLKRRTP
jgi:hypothetical protein